MQISCGTDIIEIERVRKAIQEGKERFLNTIYTEKEIKYCESKNMSKYQHYAARFAAKEAVYKALSSFINDKYSLNWKDVEILNNAKGKPIIIFLKETPNIESIDISISHCKEYAVATVIVSYMEEQNGVL